MKLSVGNFVISYYSLTVGVDRCNFEINSQRSCFVIETSFKIKLII